MFNNATAGCNNLKVGLCLAIYKWWIASSVCFCWNENERNHSNDSITENPFNKNRNDGKKQFKEYLDNQFGVVNVLRF